MEYYIVYFLPFPRGTFARFSFACGTFARFSFACGTFARFSFACGTASTVGDDISPAFVLLDQVLEMLAFVLLDQVLEILDLSLERGPTCRTQQRKAAGRDALEAF